jgi:sarcosine oxidase
VLRVERCVLAHLAQAQSLGAQLVVGESVLRWSASANDVEVTTDKATYRGRRLILAAGPWSKDLLSSLGIPLQVRRKHIHWYPAAAASYAADHGAPAFLYETAVGEFYGIPAFEGHGLKAGEHSGGAAVADPLADDRGVDPADRRRVEAFLDAHLPGVRRPALAHSTCFYTMSPDRHFIVDRHPEYASVAFAAGLSGHGFKFTCVLGEALADLALNGRTELPIEFLSAKRFADKS